jgi:hypothetical protein
MTTRKSARPSRSRDVTKRTVQACETSDAIDFDAALRAYLNGGSHEELLRAAGKVIDCDLPFAPERADTISMVTDHLDAAIETYGHAAHAIRHWFFQMREPGGP